MNENREHSLVGRPKLNLPEKILLSDLRRGAFREADRDIRVQRQATMLDERNTTAKEVARLIVDNPRIKTILAMKTSEFAEACRSCEKIKAWKSENHPLAWYRCDSREEPSFESKCAMVSMQHDCVMDYNRIGDEALLIYPDLMEQLGGFFERSRRIRINYFGPFYHEICQSDDFKPYLQGSGAESSGGELRAVLAGGPEDTVREGKEAGGDNSDPPAGGDGGKKKIYKLIDFPKYRCEPYDYPNAMKNQILRKAKAKDFFMPETANAAKGQRNTKTFYEDDLVAAWPGIKLKMPNLPNIK